MRRISLPALKLTILAFGLTWTSLHGIPLVGQTFVPTRPGAMQETSYPVGDPLLLAARETPTPTGAVRTNPPEIRVLPEAESRQEVQQDPKTTPPPKTSWFSKFKKPKKKKEEVHPDDGLEAVEWMNAERNFTNRDYVESATRHNSTSGKDDYRRGLSAENQGNLDVAVRHYSHFIKLNSTETTNGTLAAPYHRLALIAWKQQRNKEANAYFRYAMKYAQGGNIGIIAGDYSLFLMEQGETARAEVMLRNALAYSPENPRLLIFLGRCLARQDRPIEALRHLSKAVGEEQAYVEMAQVYRQTGEWDSARVVEEKRNEFLAEKRRRATPVQHYVYQPRTPYPVPITPPALPAAPVPPNRSVASPVAAPAASVGPFPATPVAMVAPNGVVQLPTVPYPGPGQQASPAWHAPAPQPHPFAHPAVDPETIPRNSPKADEGWHPHVPVAPGIEVSGTDVFHYPDGSGYPVYYGDMRTVSEMSRSRRTGALSDPPPMPPQIGSTAPGYPR